MPRWAVLAALVAIVGFVSPAMGRHGICVSADRAADKKSISQITFLLKNGTIPDQWLMGDGLRPYNKVIRASAGMTLEQLEQMARECA